MDGFVAGSDGNERMVLVLKKVDDAFEKKEHCGDGGTKEDEAQVVPPTLIPGAVVQRGGTSLHSGAGAVALLQVGFQLLVAELPDAVLMLDGGLQAGLEQLCQPFLGLLLLAGEGALSCALLLAHLTAKAVNP